MKATSGDPWREIGTDSTPNTVEYLKSLKRANQAGDSGPATTPAVTIPARSEAEPSNSSSERRLNARYKCQGSVEFRVAASDVRTWATITDISRSGCYVELQATSPVNTCFDMLVEINGIRVRTQGVVRVSYPFLGMGIAFTEMSESDRANIEQMIARLAASIPGGTTNTQSADPLPLTDAGEVVQAIAAFFRTNPMLSHAEFLEIVSRHRKHSQGASHI